MPKNPINWIIKQWIQRKSRVFLPDNDNAVVVIEVLDVAYLIEDIEIDNNNLVKKPEPTNNNDRQQQERRPPKQFINYDINF